MARNDPAAILDSVAQLSWRFAVVLCFPQGLVMLLDTAGWRFAFLKAGVPWWSLVTARLAGEAFNLVTPTAALGGEIVKVWLLRGQAPLDARLSSVVVAKTTITMAQGLFLLIGVALAWESPLRQWPLLQGAIWLLVLEAIGLGAFVVAQTRGLLSWSGRLLTRVGVRHDRGPALDGIDHALARFYRTAPWRLTLSTLFHLAAWVLGSLEAWLVLRFLGVEVSLPTAAVIEALGTAVRFATFLIPASLGALEGGYVVIFAALGLGSPVAIAFSLVRRVREAAWIGLGLLAFALMRPGAVGDAPAARGDAPATRGGGRRWG